MTTMQDRGYKSQLDVDEQETAVKQAKMAVKIKQLEIQVLEDFTKNEELVTLQGDWEAAKEAANGHEEVLRNDEIELRWRSRNSNVA